MVFQYAPIRADNHRRSQWISDTDSFCTAVQRGARQGVQKTLHRQRINAVWQAIRQQVQGGVKWAEACAWRWRARCRRDFAALRFRPTWAAQSACDTRPESRHVNRGGSLIGQAARDGSPQKAKSLDCERRKTGSQ